MQIARSRRPQTSIEMSPLIDCVFQLLIFFMLSSTFLAPSIEITLPQASQETDAQAQQLLITLSKDGKVFVNAQESSFEQLEADLRSQLAEAEDKSVTIRGDKDMPYHNFVRALDIANRSGASSVNIAHQLGTAGK